MFKVLNRKSPSHSADVQMWLDCGVHGIVQLCRISPERVESPAPRDIPPCSAELVVIIDGDEGRAPVDLFEGFSAARRFAPVINRTPVANNVAPF